MEKSLRNFLTFSHHYEMNGFVSFICSVQFFCRDLLGTTVPDLKWAGSFPVLVCGVLGYGVYLPLYHGAPVCGVSASWDPAAPSLSVLYACSAFLPPWLCWVSVDCPFPPAFSLWILSVCSTQLTGLFPLGQLRLRRQNSPFPLPTGGTLHLRPEDIAMYSFSCGFGGLWILSNTYLLCHLGLWCEYWFSGYHFSHLWSRYIYISLLYTSISISLYIMGFGRIKMVSESYIALCLGHDRYQINTVCSVICIKCHCCLLACGLFRHHLSLALASSGAEPELGFFVSSKGSAQFLHQLCTRFPVRGFNTRLMGSFQLFVPSHLTWAGLGGLGIFIYDSTWSLPHLAFRWQQFLASFPEETGWVLELLTLIELRNGQDILSVRRGRFMK